MIPIVSKPQSIDILGYQLISKWLCIQTLINRHQRISINIQMDDVDNISMDTLSTNFCHCIKRCGRSWYDNRSWLIRYSSISYQPWMKVGGWMILIRYPLIFCDYLHMTGGWMILIRYPLISIDIMWLSPHDMECLTQWNSIWFIYLRMNQRFKRKWFCFIHTGLSSARNTWFFPPF